MADKRYFIPSPDRGQLLSRAKLLQKCAVVEPDRQEVYLTDEEGGNLIGLILGNNAAIQGWADQEEVNISKQRTRDRRDFMKLFKGKKVGVIDEIRVYRRGKGMGSKLLEGFIARAIGNGCAAVIIQVGIFEKQHEGFDLTKWYERHGFETKGMSGELPLMMRSLTK